jgi:hypothetical protein
LIRWDRSASNRSLGAGWARRRLPERLRATYNRKHGIRYIFGALDVHRDRLHALVVAYTFVIAGRADAAPSTAGLHLDRGRAKTHPGTRFASPDRAPPSLRPGSHDPLVASAITAPEVRQVTMQSSEG